MKDLNPAAVKPPARLRMNKRLYIIVLCFLISTLFWLLLALSHEYPTTLTYPVKYTNLPGKKIVMNDLPSKITVQLKASGFKIMSWGLKSDQEVVKVDVSANLSSSSMKADVLALPTRSFLLDFSKELGNEVVITGFQPDSIVFNFSDLTTKKVPVIPTYHASFERQFDSTGSAEVIPSTIEVSGPPSLVSELNSVTTEMVRFENLKETARVKAKLIGNKLLSYNITEVELVLPVEKFTESSVQVEVHPVNVTAGYSLKTFPDKIKVRYLVSLSNYNKVNESMFDAIVDATDLEKKSLSKLNVELMIMPSFARVTQLEPFKVDYILRKQ